MVRKIKLRNGEHTIVDDEDYENLSKFNWRRTKFKSDLTYVVRNIREQGKLITRYMHREIMNPPSDKQVDHINGDKLDNRKSNLRICTEQENHCNVGKTKNNVSGYKGVGYTNKNHRKWRARIASNGKLIHLGCFDSPMEAHEAYKKAAIDLHGEFARFE